MYSRRSGLILAFHGCDEKVRDKVLKGSPLLPSANDYDWLGHGMYFWENNNSRAVDFAHKAGIKKPSVLGAVIDLGNCLDLLDNQYLTLLKDSYDNMVISYNQLGNPLPANKDKRRILDCAVIQNLHEINPGAPFDSVMGVFIEGKPVYDGAGINDKNHIQICIRNPNCIKGFFMPRSLSPGWNKV